MNIGFVGQGYVGKNYADDFERRGHRVVRYSLEEPYVQNKDLIKTCDMVFIAVPTPTTPKGSDVSIVRQAITLAAEGAVVVIKSTVVPGMSQRLQEEYPKHDIFFSPEFLSENTAAQDVAKPFASIVGMPIDDDAHRAIAQRILDVLPPAPFSLVCKSTEAELIKYIHNINGYAQVVFFNLFFDMAKKLDAQWDVIKKAVDADPFMCNAYAQPEHKTGRGAGGHCFVKDFAALRGRYAELLNDEKGDAFLKSLEEKNLDLLASSGKDADIVKEVYGVK